MGLANRLVTLFLDHKGDIGRMVVYVAAAVIDPSGAAVQAVRDAIKLLTKAVPTKETITKSNDIAGTSPNPPSNDGYFSDIDDRCVFVFIDPEGQTHSLEVPGPADAAFVDASASDEIDVESALVQNVASAVEATFKTAEGRPLSFITAFYARRQSDLP